VDDGEASSTNVAPELQGLEQTRGKGFGDFHPTPNLQETNMTDTQANIAARWNHVVRLVGWASAHHRKHAPAG